MNNPMITEPAQTRETFKLDRDAALEIIHNDSDKFEEVSKEFVYHRRLVVRYRHVVRRYSDGKLFAVFFSKAATEGQEDDASEEFEFTEVFAQVVATIEYF